MWSYEVLKFHDLYGIWGGPNRQMAQVTEKYIIKQRTPYTFSPELETELDIDENHYLN